MKKKITILTMLILVVSACSPQTPVAVPVLPQAATAIKATSTSRPPTHTPQPILPTRSPEPTFTATPAETLFPTVTFSEKIVCREGPDSQYFPVVTYSAGQTSQVQSRSEDSAWLVVLSQVPNKSSICWVPVTSVEEFGDVNYLLVSTPPTLPTGASRAVSSRGVCGVNRQGAIVVEWSPVAFGTGYYVYRNGVNIATVYGGSYIDHDTPGSKTPYVYTYVIQAFNSVGLSKVTAAVSVTLCD